MAKTPKYIIVKYATTLHPDEHASMNDHVGNTFTAQECGMNKPYYATREEAQAACRILQTHNPTVDYGVRIAIGD